MPKFKIVCVLLAAVLAAVGTVLVVKNLVGGGEIPFFEKPTEDPNTYIELTDDVDINDADVDVRKFLFIAHKVLLDGEGFYGVANGSTSAAGIKQNVRNTRYVIGEFDNKSVLKEMVTSGVTKNAYQLYMMGNNYIYRDKVSVNSLDSVKWSDTAQPLTEDAFYNRFGHRNDKLTGYILNWDTVLEGKLTGVKDGIYTFRYVLDNDTATKYLRREMITNGGLVDEPTFSKCVIHVAMDANFNVKTLRTDCAYKADLGFLAASCTEDITEVFEPYSGELPYSDFYKDYLDKKGSDIDDKMEALDVLLAMFGPYLNGEDLQVALSANNNGKEIFNGKLSISGLDISDLGKLQVAAKLGDVDVSYVNSDSTIYLKYQDFQGSTTVDGILGLVDTVTQLLGDGTETLAADDSLLGDFDAESLLENLTFRLYDDDTKCVVNLPVSVAGLNIDANLYADVDGETYTFTHATVTVGNVEVTINPESWTVDEINKDEYPEILGLADLIQEGKLSMSANLGVTLGGSDYTVVADVLVDLATANLKVTATLDKYGTVTATLVDGVAYLTFGEIKVKLDTANIDELIEQLQRLLGEEISLSAPTSTLSVNSLFASFGGIKATKCDDGRLAFTMSLGDVDAALYLKSVEGRWQLDSIVILADGIVATVAPSDSFGEITAPSDKDDYADINELVDTFVNPILNMLNADSYGADFDVTLTVNGKEYRVAGSFALDVRGNIMASATVYSGSVGVIDAQVIYSNNVVYLTLNGVNVAFELGKGDNIDINAVLNKLVDNEQIKDILNNHEELSELIEKLAGFVSTAINYRLSDLLDVDFSAIVTDFKFVDGILSLTVDGSVLGFDGLSVDLTFANNDGCLAVTVGGLATSSVGLNIAATLNTDVEDVKIPNADDYVLNLNLQVLGADVDLTADLINMDIWARIQYNSEVLRLRYVDGKVYVQYGGANIAFDAADTDEIISKISKLIGETGQKDISVNLDVLAVLAAISADFTGEQPNVSLNVKGVSAKINFVNKNNKLVFSNITVSFDIKGKTYSATLVQQAERAEQLDVDGEFVDGNALLEQLLTTVEALSDGKVYVEASVDVTVDGKKYVADIVMNVNGGLYAKALLKDGNNKVTVSAEIYLVDGVLYFDVNGIRQAIELPKSNGEFDIEQIAAIIAQLEGRSDAVDKILQTVAKLPECLDGVVFSQIIQKVSFSEDILAVELNLDQFDLGGVVLTLGLDNELTACVNGFATDKFALNANVTVRHSDSAVLAPEVESYVTELKVTVGDITAYVKLDLYNKTVLGVAEVYGEKINFKYYDGVVYATLGAQNRVGVKFSLEDIDALLDAISHFVELPDISMGNVDFVGTVTDVLDKISFAKVSSSDGYAVEITYDGIAVAVHFDCSTDKATLAAIEIGVGDITVSAEQVSGIAFADLSTNDNYVDIAQVATEFAEPIAEIINASGYEIGIGATLTVGGKTYAIDATLTTRDGNVHLIFDITHNRVTMFKDAELWVVGDRLYLSAGDIKLALKLDRTSEKDNEEFTVDRLKSTLKNAKGYNGSVDKVIDLVIKILDTSVEDVSFEQLLSSLTFVDGELGLTVDGGQFDVSVFTVGLSARNGLNLSVGDFSYCNITLNVTNASVAPYNADIVGPGADEDFTTNLVIDVQEYDNANNVSGEHNVIYVNIDLLNGVVLARIETTMSDGSVTYLDIKYTFADNVLKITNGAELNVLVNIDSIADIVDSINDIVNDFADAGDQALPDLFGALGPDLDLKAIVQSLNIRNENGQVLVGLSAMSFKLTAAFKNGLKSVTIPIDLIESNLVVSFSNSKHGYSNFSDGINYVSIDQVFNDYYYGNGTQDEPNGAIYNLVHTNSWKFDFLTDSEIDVKNDDGTTTTYQIIAGSYIAFYYNKTEKDNIKVRAYLTVQKDRKEFLYLDVALFDGRVYVTYDSNKSNNNKNDLKATVSLDAIKGTVSLLPALIKVVPQIGDLLDRAKEAMSSMQSKLTLGNVSKILHSVSYGQVNGKNVFTLQINGQAIDVNNFGKDPITLKVSNYGNAGLSLDELSLTYGNVSVNLANLVVTGSGRNAQTGEFEYVEKYIYSYNTANHINLDSIRELLSAFVITADNVDENGVRSFTIDGSIDATLLGNRAIIGITIHVDIDKDNNVYLAVKLTRDAKGILSGAIYADDGGYSYMLLDTKESTISLYRNSRRDYTYCSWCKSWTCTSTILHAGGRKSYSYLDTEAPVGNKLPSFSVVNMSFSEFTADTKTMVGYILDAINFGSLIDGRIRDAIGKENTNVYGIEDILKSYTYTYSANDQSGKFAIKVDLSPIDSALGDITANILHVGDLDSITCDEDGNLFGDGVQLTEINGTATMIKIMDATYTLTLKDAVSGRAYGYVIGNNYLW